MIWPFIMGTAVILAANSWAASKRRDAAALFAIFTALVAVRAKNAVFYEYADLRVALGALIWSTTAVWLMRQQYSIQSGILILVALCSAWALAVGAEPVIGSPPYVTADALVVLTMLWIGHAGILATARSLANLVGRSDRHSTGSADTSRAQDN